MHTRRSRALEGLQAPCLTSSSDLLVVGKVSCHRVLPLLLPVVLPLSSYRTLQSGIRTNPKAVDSFSIVAMISVYRAQISCYLYTTNLKHGAGVDATDKEITLWNFPAYDILSCVLFMNLGGGCAMERWGGIIAAQKERKERKERSIGISTFGMRHIKELSESGPPLPAVYLVRHRASAWSVLVSDRVLSIYYPCRNRGVLQGTGVSFWRYIPRSSTVRVIVGTDTQAWSALAWTMRSEHPSIVRLRKKYRKGPPSFSSLFIAEGVAVFYPLTLSDTCFAHRALICS
jgi:hypothetical protein